MRREPLESVVRRFLERHGGEGPWLVACSGGADSVALACLVAGAARELERGLGLAHVDHGIRRESGEDARFVEGLAGRLDLPFLVRSLELGRASEAAARKARLDALLDMADEFGASHVLLAHTAEDQAETVLMRLVRGSGIRGLAAMAPVRGRFLRPLLSVRKEMLRAYLLQRGQAWREDPSNRDERYFRNRVRHRLLPALQDENPRLVETLCRLASSVRADLEALDAALEALVASSVLYGRAGDLGAARISGEVFARFGSGGLWWVLRRVHFELARGKGQLGAVHLHEVLNRGAADLPGGLRVEKVAGGWVVLPRRWEQEPPAGPWRVESAGEFRLPGSGWLVSVQGSGCREGELWLAPWRPGDRLQGRSRKVQDLFVDSKLHRWLRHRLPLGRIGGPREPVAWVPGLWPGGWTWTPEKGCSIRLRAAPGSVEAALVEVLWPEGSGLL